MNNCSHESQLPNSEDNSRRSVILPACHTIAAQINNLYIEDDSLSDNDDARIVGDLELHSMKFPKPRSKVENPFPEKFTDNLENLYDICQLKDAGKDIYPGLADKMDEFLANKRKYKQNKVFRAEVMKQQKMKRAQNPEKSTPADVIESNCSTVDSVPAHPACEASEVNCDNTHIQLNLAEDLFYKFSDPIPAYNETIEAVEKKSGFYFLRGSIGEQLVELLIDTGAKVNFIARNFVPKNAIIRKNKITVHSFNGSSVAQGEVTLDLTIRNTAGQRLTLTLCFIVLNEMRQYGGFLGIQTLRSITNSKLDLGRGLWSFDIKDTTHKILLTKQTAPLFNVATLAAHECILLPQESAVIQTTLVDVDQRHALSCTVTSGYLVEPDVITVPSCGKVRKKSDSFCTELQVCNLSADPITISKNQFLGYVDVVALGECTLTTENMMNVLHNTNTSTVIDEIRHKTDDVLLREKCKLHSILEEEIDCQINNASVDEPIITHKRDISPELLEQFRFMSSLPEVARDKPILTSCPPDNSSPLYRDLNSDKQRVMTKDLEDLKDKYNLVLPDEYLQEGTLDSQCYFEKQSTDKRFSTDDVNISHIPVSYQPRYKELFSMFADAFARHDFDISTNSYITHTLQVDQVPPAQKQRYMSRTKLDMAQAIISKYIENNVVSECAMPAHVSNLVLVPKFKKSNFRTKADQLNNQDDEIKTYRIVQDLRTLNSHIINDKKCTVTTFSDIATKLTNHRLINSADLNQAYYTIELCPKSQPLTAFYLGNKIYQWRKLSQGLKNAPASMQRLNEKLFSHEVFQEAVRTIPAKYSIVKMPARFEDFLCYYFDDHWTAANEHEENLCKLYLYLYALKKGGVKINPNKFEVAKPEAKILGIMVDSPSSSMRLDYLKANAMLQLPRPSSLYELHSRLASFLYYAKFIPNLKEVGLPLYFMLRNGQFVWTDVEEKAWRSIISLIVADIKLAIPTSDDQLYLFTDASKYSASQVLFMEQEQHLRVVACNSNLFSYQDSLKISYLKEAISLVKGLKTFNDVITNSSKPLIVFTDAKSLIYIGRNKTYCTSSFHLSNFMASYIATQSIRIMHVAGRLNVLADLLSRSLTNTRFKNYLNALSKEKAKQLPDVEEGDMFPEDAIYRYLTTEPKPEVGDIYSRLIKQPPVPRPISNLIKTATDKTREELLAGAYKLLNPPDAILDTDADLNSANADWELVSRIYTELPTMLIDTRYNDGEYITAAQDIDIETEVMINITFWSNCHFQFESCTDSYNVTARYFDRSLMINIINPSPNKACILKGTKLLRLKSMEFPQIYPVAAELIQKMELPIVSTGVEIHNLKVEWTEDILNIPVTCEDDDPTCKDHNSPREYENNSPVQLQMAVTRSAKQAADKDDNITHLKGLIAKELCISKRMPADLLYKLQMQDDSINRFLKTGKYVLKNGVVRHAQKNTVCIPESMIDEVIRFIHTEFRHPNAEESIRIFTTEYTIHNVAEYVNSAIRNCFTCSISQEKVSKNIALSAQRSMKPLAPGTHIYLDIITGFPPTPEGFSGFLLSYDAFSKKASAQLIKNKSVNQIYGAIVNFFTNTMIAEQLYSDSDIAIQAAVEKLWAEGVPVQYFQSPREAQHRNAVENCWRLVKRRLEKLRSDPTLTTQWPILLMMALNSINMIPMKSLVSRLQLHFGTNFAKSSLKFAFEDQEEFSNESSDSQREKILAKTSKPLKKFAIQEGDFYFVKYSQNTILGPFQAKEIDLERKQLKGLKLGSKTIFTHSFKNVTIPALKNIQLPLGHQWDADFKKKLDNTARPTSS